MVQQRASCQHRCAQARGMTLFEVVMILILLAIMATTVSVHVPAETGEAIRANAERMLMLARLSHVRTMAIVNGEDMTLKIDANCGSSYSPNCTPFMYDAPDKKVSCTEGEFIFEASGGLKKDSTNSITFGDEKLGIKLTIEPGGFIDVSSGSS